MRNGGRVTKVIHKVAKAGQMIGCVAWRVQLVSILAVVAGSSVLTDGGCGGIQRDGKGLVEVSMSL